MALLSDAALDLIIGALGGTCDSDVEAVLERFSLLFVTEEEVRQDLLAAGWSQCDTCNTWVEVGELDEDTQECENCRT